jgi:uncharacterized RDD family membrane protein YckC
MSTNEPPAMGEPTPPPPPPPVTPDPVQSAAPPPPPPPPAPATSTASFEAGAAPVGPPRPGELMDRFIARFIDFIILGVVYGIIAGIVGGAIITGYRTGAEAYFYYLIVGILSAVIYLAYFAWMESNRGDTVGTMVMKLKTVGPDGVSKPTMEQAVRRNIWVATGLISIIPLVGWWLGGVASLAAAVLILVGINGDPGRRQHWFDKFAGGTQVLKVG